MTASLSRRTWNDFAGYSTVTVLHGPIGGVQSRTRKLFHRGMDGDYMGSGQANRYAYIQDSNGENALDQYPLRGFLREEQTLNGSGAVVAKTLHGPTLNLNPATVNGGTAHRSASWPGGTFDAFLLREYKTTTAQWVAATNSWRTTDTEKSFDDVYGLVESTFDEGDTSTTSDDTCTTTSYAQNTDDGLVNYPAQTLTTDCTPNATGLHILAGTQTLYDGSTTVGAAPTAGRVTQTNTLSAVSGSALTWSLASRSDYDPLGRVVAAYDALGRKTTTVYTPPAGGPLTRTTTINPLGYGVTTNFEPGRRLPMSVVDANGKASSLTYDGLGRLREVYKPHGTGGAATGYSVTAGSAPYVAGTTTVALTGDDEHTQISLPFAFPYWGNSYTSAWLSTNGLLSFTDHGADGANILTGGPPNSAIYAFWDDLNLTASSTVKTKTVGAAPNRQFVIDYHNVGFWDRPGAVSFSITLAETSGVITLNYTDIDPNDTLERGDSATVGVENAAGTASVLYLDDTPSLADNRTVTFTPITARATTLPDIAYDYALSNTDANVVSTKVLTPAGTQLESLELYDGRFRLVQTQTPAPQAHGGRNIVNTYYNDHGGTARTSTFYNKLPISRSLTIPIDPDTDITQHRFTYDDLDRPTVDALYLNTTLRWQTTTGYDGDRTWTVPPSGGMPTMKLTDTAGNTVALRQYTSGTPPTSGSYQTTTYAYDRLNRLTGLTDPDGVQWSNIYDLRGRVVSSTDPDKGTSTLTYDETGQLIKTVDGRNITMSYGYDDLGRRTGVFDGPTTNGFKRAGWVYDSLARGQLTSSTRYLSNGDTYTTSATGYNDQYQPLGASVSLPAALGPLAGDYTVEMTYNIDGSAATTKLPAAGSLAAETLTTGYDSTGRMRSLTGNGVYADDDYVADTSYYDFGPVYQQILGTGTKRVELTTDIDEATGRLTNSRVRTTNQTTTTAWEDRLNQAYTYDDTGNLKSINETGASRQCFTYDGLQQLKEAWTTTATACQTTPTQTDVGGPDPYWSSYTYTTTGSRATEKKHATAGDTTYTYTYPTTGRRHTLTSVVADDAATSTNNYTYDGAGNTTVRKVAGKPDQTLTWDNEGHLASVADSTGTTTYVYDADGNRLLGTDPTGTTAYLGAFELKKVGSTVSGTRFYGGASRTPTGLTWIASDPHGTGELAIDATTLAATRRKTDPFGNPRGTDPTWPNTKGFVGGTRDTATGLTHLGAREYDPTIGRFTSGDPVVNLADPQSMGGYTYARNNPTTLSDPGGQDPGGRCDLAGMCTSQVNDCKSTNYASAACKGVYGAPSRLPETKPSNDDINKANDIKKKSALDIIIEAGGQLILEFFGINDVLKCVTKGDIGACAMAVAGALPWGKMLKAMKLGKILVKAGKALLKWMGDIKWAERILKDAEKVAETAATKADDVLAKCHSFDPDTRVLMADGTTKPIKDVDIGDEVKATDPATGETTDRKVIVLHRNLDREMTNVTVVGPTGETSTLHTTPNHPFWDETDNHWTDAGTLTIGHKLRSATGAALLTVVAVLSFANPKHMNDLTVDAIHTYYVMAGQTSLLVHNCDPVPNGKPNDLPLEQMEADIQGVKPAFAGSDEFASAMKGDGHYLWAVNESGKLGIVPAGPGIKHTVITGGDSVIGAGQMSIRNGRVTMFDNWTGHYTPKCACSKTFLQNGSDAFRNAGVRIPLSSWRDYGGVG